MTVQRFFQIHYGLREERQTFIQPDQKMSDADAWYYACLHAKIGVPLNVPEGRDELTVLMEHAEKYGLTQVCWEEWC